jgi:hypothetical protein
VGKGAEGCSRSTRPDCARLRFWLRRCVKGALKFALANLTANLIRIVTRRRKTGPAIRRHRRAHRVYNEYCGAFDRAPDGPVISALLDFNTNEDHPNDDRLDEVLRENAICRISISRFVTRGSAHSSGKSFWTITAPASVIRRCPGACKKAKSPDKSCNGSEIAEYGCPIGPVLNKT